VKTLGIFPKYVVTFQWKGQLTPLQAWIDHCPCSIEIIKPTKTMWKHKRKKLQQWMSINYFPFFSSFFYWACIQCTYFLVQKRKKPTTSTRTQCKWKKLETHMYEHGDVVKRRHWSWLKTTNSYRKRWCFHDNAHAFLLQSSSNKKTYNVFKNTMQMKENENCKGEPKKRGWHYKEVML
jgi:hypothetical protein